MLAQRLKLVSKVALVTGAAQGIGRAFAHALGEAGAAVAVVDVNADKAEATVAELRGKGVRSIAVQADVTKAADCKRCCRRCYFVQLKQKGRLSTAKVSSPRCSQGHAHYESPCLDCIGSCCHAVPFQSVARQPQAPTKHEVTPHHRMVETVIEQLGGLHIAVNNAGINKNAAAEDTTEADWDATFGVNTKGLFLCCQVSFIIAHRIARLSMAAWQAQAYLERSATYATLVALESPAGQLAAGISCREPHPRSTHYACL